jgi:hypothetical protein
MERAPPLCSYRSPWRNGRPRRSIGHPNRSTRPNAGELLRLGCAGVQIRTVSVQSVCTRFGLSRRASGVSVSRKAFPGMHGHPRFRGARIGESLTGLVSGAEVTRVS